MRKIINYPQFYNQLSPSRVFSRAEAEKVFPQLDSRRLFEWKEKGYLDKLTNKWYLFSNNQTNEGLTYLISNSICQPSYISLESALIYYQLLKIDQKEDSLERSTYAITKHKSVVYNTCRGVFAYKKIKPEYFFGYRPIEFEGKMIEMATKEKALIDFLYFNAQLNSISKLSGLPWNVEALLNLDWKSILKMQENINSKALNRRMDLLKKGLKMTDF